MLKAKARRVVAVCYAAALLGWLAVNFGLFFYDRSLPATTLDAADALLVNLTALEEGGFVSENGDPQWLFEGIDTPVRRVRLVAAFAQRPGETDLYYTRKPGGGYSPRRRVFGALQPDGSHLYTLPPGRVLDLRVDAGTVAGNRIGPAQVVLNPRLPLAAYLAPRFSQALWLAAVPAFAAAWICTIIEAAHVAARRRKAARKERKGR